jgi:transposase
MLLIGIDQSPKKHDICITDKSGCQLARGEVPHDWSGFQWIHEQCKRLGVAPQDCLVAVESAYNLLVDYLLDHGYQVYVVPGRAVNRYRDRHRQSRSRNDPGDAVVLADILRTDRHLYVALTADSPQTRQICSLVRLLSTLKRNTVRVGNQLRDLLWRYYPIAADLFSKLDQPLTCAFIQAYPTPQLAQGLSLAEFEDFCHRHRYWHGGYIARRYGQLQNAQTFARQEVADAYAQQAQSLARVLLSLVQERKAAQKTLSQVFQQHPQAPTFASLPGAGEFLAPALLSKFRDCRARFPTAAVAQAIAGTCPVTDQSGKRRRILFRRACDREFRFIATEFARCSVPESGWAAAYFEALRPRVDKASHAYRALANRWIAIIWRLWTDRVEYDEAIHLRNRFIHRQQRQTP